MRHPLLWDEADDRLDRLNVDLLAVYQDVAFRKDRLLMARSCASMKQSSTNLPLTVHLESVFFCGMAVAWKCQSQVAECGRAWPSPSEHQEGCSCRSQRDLKSMPQT